MNLFYIACLFIFSFNKAQAHNIGDHYLIIYYEQNGSFLAEWDFPYKYVQNIIGNKAEQPEEQLEYLKQNRNKLLALSEQVSFSSFSGSCRIQKIEQKEIMNSMAYGEISYQGQCDDSSLLEISFKNLESESDPMLISFYSVKSEQSIITGSNSVPVRIGVDNGAIKNIYTYVLGGIWHIWGGVDHILFLIVLILPCVYFVRNKEWVVRDSSKLIILELIKNVTAFTLAHSITLSLVTLGWIKLPVYWVEIIIAFSVLVTALNNLRPIIWHGRWILAFLFGLVHGVGFAEVLVGLHLPLRLLLQSLFGFNLGVEIGQLTIIAIFLPIALVLRNTKIYRHLIFQAGSAAVAIVAFIWCLERFLTG